MSDVRIGLLVVSGYITVQRNDAGRFLAGQTVARLTRMRTASAAMTGIEMVARAPIRTGGCKWPGSADPRTGRRRSVGRVHPRSGNRRSPRRRAANRVAE